jgi:TolB-like protein
MEIFMNRFSFLAGAAAIMIGAGVSMAAPTTAPSQPPAESVTASPATYSSVLVLPFAPVAGASDWIGKGIQEDLATDMVQASRLNVLTPTDAPAASDSAAACKIGQDIGASLVAFGTYQIVDSDVRINGQLVDTATGKPLAALKATGPRRDLFHMEDLLATQAVASLPPTSIKVGNGAYASTNESASPAEPFNSQGFYVTPGPDFTPTYDHSAATTPATTYVNGYSANPYDYAYDGYDYPFFGDGFFFISGFGDHHHHDRDHDGDGHRFNGTDLQQPEVFRGASENSPASGEISQSTHTFSDGGSTHTATTFHNSVNSAGMHAAGNVGGGEFGAGFHGGMGGHR